MKYLIASHGEYAAGLASAVRRLAGENPDVTALCAYTDEVPLETHMQKIMAGHEAETWIIMTDLLGGSVNQYMIDVYKRQVISSWMKRPRRWPTTWK